MTNDDEALTSDEWRYARELSLVSSHRKDQKTMTRRFCLSDFLFALAVFTVAIGFVAVVTECGPTGKKVATDVGACAAPEIAGAVTDALPDVIAALKSSDADWAAYVPKIEARGLAFAICAVRAAIADLLGKYGAPTASAPIERGRAYLKSRGVER